MTEREPINESLFLITDPSYVVIVNQDDVNDINDERESERESFSFVQKLFLLVLL